MKSFLLEDKFLLDITIFLVGFSIPFSFAFNSICIGLFVIYSFVFFDKNRIKKLFNYKEVYFYFILFYIFQVISYFYSANRDLAFDNLSRNIVFVILPISFLSVKNQINKISFKSLFYGLLAAIILFLIKAYGLLLLEITKAPSFDINDFLRERFIDKGVYQIHTPYFSMLILLVLVFLVKVNLLKSEKNNKSLKIFLSFLLIIALLLLSGLMSFIIFLFFAYSFFLTSKIKRSNKITISLILIAIAGTALFSIKNLDKIESKRGSEGLVFRIHSLLNSKNNSSIRIQNWNSVISVISDNVFFGVGVDGGINELLKYREPLTEPFINKHNAHNVYLETILRYGIFGFVVFSLLLFFLLSKAIRRENYFFLWFLIIFLTSSLTESFLQRQIGVVFFTFFSLFLYSKNNNLDLKLNK